MSESGGRRRGGGSGSGDGRWSGGGNGNRRLSGGPASYRRVQVMTDKDKATVKEEGGTAKPKAAAIDLDQPTAAPKPFKSSLQSSLQASLQQERRVSMTTSAGGTRGGRNGGRGRGAGTATPTAGDKTRAAGRSVRNGNGNGNANGNAIEKERAIRSASANGNGNRSVQSSPARRPQSATPAPVPVNTGGAGEKEVASNDRGRTFSSQDARGGRQNGPRSSSAASRSTSAQRGKDEAFGSRDSNGMRRGRSPMRGSVEKPPRRKDSVDSVSSRTSQASHQSTRSTRSTRSSRYRRRDSIDSVSSQQSVRSEVDRGDRYQRWGDGNGGRGQGSRGEGGWRGGGDRDRDHPRRAAYSRSDSMPAQPRSVPFRSSLATSLGGQEADTRSCGRRSRGSSPAPIPPSSRGWRSSLSASISREKDADPPPSTDTAAIHVSNSGRVETQSTGPRRSLSGRLESAVSNGDEKQEPPTLVSRLWANRERSSSRGSISSVGEKEARVRDYYARMDSEDKKRETARRSLPMKSSLRSSLGGSSLQSSLAASTLRASIASKSALADSSPKTTYTLEALKSFKEFAIPPPASMHNVSIAEVIKIREPVKRPLTSGSSKRGLKRSESHNTKFSRGGAAPRGRDRRSGGPGGRRREREQPPPPPLFDGPVEPIKHSENRWIKPSAKSPLETVLIQVKSILNKLTREKFDKLTKELCAIEIKSLVMLRSVISVVMDKAVEEPNFSDVYADLCKVWHARSSTKAWSFLQVAESISTPGQFYWTAVQPDDNAGFLGPFTSREECFENSRKPAEENVETRSCDTLKAKFWIDGLHIVSVCEEVQGSFFYRKREIASLGEDEPVIGEFDSDTAALQAATKQITFKRLLVTRCQFEFERWHGQSSATPMNDDALDERQRQINAIREKRSMLGNIRFIGELFKANMVNHLVVQHCMFSLLGLELIAAEHTQNTTAKILRSPQEDDIEALCKLLSTVGKVYDKPATQHIMKIVILRLVELSEDKELPSRARFLLKDILEMRDYSWEPRRKELQQKTLEEVRREAMQLQQQGKNAQHDDLSKRRHKSQISSAQLARQSSNLLIQQQQVEELKQSDEVEEVAASSFANPVDGKKLATRAKGIVQEYISIHDLEEAAQCVSELPAGFVSTFIEHAVNCALDGKVTDRNDAVELLVKLYERGSIDATTIQATLSEAMEYLEDMSIDIPLVHQYSALLFGRLIAAGCFGLSWMVSKALPRLVACGLASKIFAEALGAIADESDDSTVAQMLTDEEIDAARVLPASARDSESVRKFITDNALEAYFDGSDEDEEDDTYEMDMPLEVEHKMRSTLEEYLNVRDLEEVILCVNELEKTCGALRWGYFVRVCALYGIDGDADVRSSIAKLLSELVERSQVSVDDLERAFASILLEFDDLRVDIPKVARNLSELWSPLLFMHSGLTISWLYNSTRDLVSPNHTAEVLSASLNQLETLYGAEQLVEWWRKQQGSETWWTAGRGQDNALDADLARWQQKLCV